MMALPASLPKPPNPGFPNSPVSSRLTPDAPLWRWAYEAVSHRVETMLDPLEGVREGEDIEAVHDMRVGSRRLVAAMRVFRTCFPEPRYEELLREARQVTRALGLVRDLDVLIDHYERLEAGPDEESGVRYFIARQARQRSRERRPMLRALEKLEKTDFPGRLRKYLHEAADEYRVGLDPAAFRSRDGAGDGGADPHGPFRDGAPPFLTERHREFYECARYVEQPEMVTELHEMRIAAKWLRYTMELFAPAYRNDLKRPIDAVKKCQELLGEIHDSDVRIAILTEMTGRPLKPGGLEAIRELDPAPVGRALRALLDREHGERERLYRSFLGEWRRLEDRGFEQNLLRRIRQPDALLEGVNA